MLWQSKGLKHDVCKLPDMTSFNRTQGPRHTQRLLTKIRKPYDSTGRQQAYLSSALTVWRTVLLLQQLLL
jgi:hypothetical protein